MAAYAETDFFMDMSLVDDPYPYFEYLRSRGPVVRLPAHNVVAVTGFEEAAAVHLDTEHFSAVNCVTGPLPPLPFAPQGDDITAQIEAHRPQMPFGEELLTLDPPRHTPLRALMMRVFNPRRLKEVEDSITRLSDQLIDEFAAKGGCELNSEYARPFATLAIADLLGVPEEDRGEFRAAVNPPPSQVGNAGDAPVVNPMDFRRDKFFDYVEDRRRSPRGDILSDLANTTRTDGSKPDATDVVRIATLLFGAGQDTTATLLGNALKIIAERPDLQAQLRADPSLIPDFLEEVLRISGPVKSTFRLARKPTSLAGVDIPVGATVMITTAAVNRDPRKFDSPADFKLERSDVRDHLSFGRGLHSCPGAPLARIEARISLERLLARLDEIGIDPDFHGPAGERRFAYVPSYQFRTLKALHLRFTPAN
ncbi:MAG: cytochrome P450 [Rhizomicrobium sp.]